MAHREGRGRAAEGVEDGGMEVGGRVSRMWPAVAAVPSWRWWWDGRSAQQMFFLLERVRGEVGAALHLETNLEILRPVRWGWWPLEDGR